MDDVSFVEVTDEQAVVDWQRIHNEIIPTDPLSPERPVGTVVLSSNADGLAFALARGYVEVETYLLPGATVPYVALELP